MKKGAVVLIFSSLAFLIASLLFLNYSLEKKNIDIYFDLVKVNDMSEKCLFFLDKTAKFALRDSLLEKEGNKNYLDLFNKNSDYFKNVENKRKVITIFRNKFNKYSAGVNDVCGSEINIKDYEINLYNNKKDFTVVGKTETKIFFVEGNVTYSIHPNFIGNIRF
jgi:hypothetical protein